MTIAHDIEAVVYHLNRVRTQLDATAKLLTRGSQAHATEPTAGTETDLDTV